MKAMDGQAYFRISWRKLICIVGALLVMGAPISASLCAVGDCSGQSPKTHSGCSGMAMPRSATSVNAQSLGRCGLCAHRPAQARTIQISSLVCPLQLA
jgi:hypothetical protein